ncbi:MAG: uroporphyrinogen-III C-methyltransferase, partial [Chloroflexota bacterium]|nr:uroporphyrinogen-III C-methyltransferase [Chloroflexota bacterium]
MSEAGGGTLGRVWLVGAGPGDPGLLTLAGKEALEQADVVLFDALVDERLLRFARPEAERIFVGKRAGAAALDQRAIEELMVRLAREGKRVVRLKGGDPFVFGRGGEEALACRSAGIPFTVVPGVTSAIAAPAYAG